MNKRQQTTQVLRNHIDGARVIDGIMQCIQWLTIGYMPVYEEPTARHTRELDLDKMTPLVWSPMSSLDLQRVKTLLQIQLSLLDKKVPSLKALELTDNTPNKQFSDLELASRVASLVDRAKREPAMNPAANPAAPAITQETPKWH